MGNIGTWQLVIILAIVVLLFGAKRLPQVAQGLGSSLKIFRKETQGLLADDDEAPSGATGTATKNQAATTEPPAVEAPQQAAGPMHNPVSEGVADQQRDA